MHQNLVPTVRKDSDLSINCHRGFRACRAYGVCRASRLTGLKALQGLPGLWV